ncbi:MAG: c-type cytochrome [Candidatus Acidiferrales bacterium]
MTGRRRRGVGRAIAMWFAVVGIGFVGFAASHSTFARQSATGQQGGQQGGTGQEKAAGVAQAPAQELEKLAARDDTRPAEQIYKNVQVLKGIPADQFVRTMKGFTNALGVRCEFCHVTAPGSDIPGFGAFSKDDLETKRTARKMILMVGDIREKYFADKEAPTCWTCHRGSKQPEFAAPKPATPPAPTSPSVPTTPPAEKK